MTKTKDHMQKDDYTEENYKIFEKKLLSPSTPHSELKRICMSLAHLPTKRAQDLLALFKESSHSHKVEWLNIAIEEGQFEYLSPQNEQEERDYLALKVIQEIWDELIDLEIKLNEAKLDLNIMEIKHEAIKELVAKGEIKATEESGLKDAMLFFKSKVEDLYHEIEIKNKISIQINESIKTKRYKDLDPLEMRNIHFY